MKFLYYICINYRQANQKIIELEGEIKDLQERGEESLSSLKVKIKDFENKLQQEKEQRTADLEERDMALAEKSESLFMFIHNFLAAFLRCHA